MPAWAGGRGCSPKGALLPHKGGSRAQGWDVHVLLGALAPENEHETLAEMQEGGG